MLLELGVSSVEFYIKKNRVNYLHHLLTIEDPSLVKLVFDEQVRKTERWDWVKTVKQDLKDLKIYLSFDEIRVLPKQIFKIMVKRTCKDACFQVLINEKQKLSKGREIEYDNFETQAYLKPG